MAAGILAVMVEAVGRRGFGLEGVSPVHGSDTVWWLQWVLALGIFAFLFYLTRNWFRSR